MIGIVGVHRTHAQVRQLFSTYLSAYYTAMERALDEAGGESLRVSIDGSDPWVPAFPPELHPSWAERISPMHDGAEFYIDIDGPVHHGVFVTQSIILHLEWPAGVDGTETFRIREVEIEAIRIRMFEDQSMDLGEARAVTSGLISAGKLMASLLEGQV